MNRCIIENCTKPVKAKDLCAMHHQRLLRHGDPYTVRPRRVKTFTSCTWIHCSKAAVTKGLCAKHYYIKRVSGASEVGVK